MSYSIKHVGKTAADDTYAVVAHGLAVAAFTGTRNECKVWYLANHNKVQPADLAALIAAKTSELNALKKQLKAQLKAA